jgi:hypothetical protein
MEIRTDQDDVTTVGSDMTKMVMESDDMFRTGTYVLEHANLFEGLADVATGALGNLESHMTVVSTCKRGEFIRRPVRTGGHLLVIMCKPDLLYELGQYDAKLKSEERVKYSRKMAPAELADDGVPASGKAITDDGGVVAP